MWKVNLAKKDREPRLHPRRHRIYKVVEKIQQAPENKMELMLTQTVPSKYNFNHLHQDLCAKYSDFSNTFFEKKTQTNKKKTLSNM